MRLSESQMSGNVYNKTDADIWMTAPQLAQTRQSSFLDVSSLVLYEEDFLVDKDKNEDPNQPLDINKLFGNNNRTN